MQSTPGYPFRLGTTSYIVPDEIIPNIRHLAGKVDDIELVLFESDEFSNLPTREEQEELDMLAREHGMTYSVHLPLDVYLGSPDRRERVRSVGKCLRVAEVVRTLPKSAFVLHFESGPGVDINTFRDDDSRRFLDSLRESAGMLLEQCGEPASSICVENLNYPYELVWPVVEEFGFSTTLDVGHLEYYGFPTADYLDRYLGNARVLHMHGSTGGKDHNSLCHMRREALAMVVDALGKCGGEPKVFTLEIFSGDDLATSLRVLEEFADHRNDGSHA
jgi:sugar phosphate isomerase/epimerase